MVENCVRRYHIFQHTWIPIHGEGLSCNREHGNRSDPFAIPVKSGEDIVGYVPRQFSCVSSLLLQSGGLLACKVSGDRHYSLDLLQEGMEIPCMYTFPGVPDLVHKNQQWLGEFKAKIKESLSGILDSLKLSNLQSSHAAVTDLEVFEKDITPEVLDIIYHNRHTDVQTQARKFG